jgi:AI-2 transport protein TqsA
MNVTDKFSNHTKLTAYFLGFISFVIFVVVLKLLENVLIPMTIAVFLTYLFYPLIQYLKSYKVPKWVSLVIIIIGVTVIYYLLVVLMISNFDYFVDNLDKYSAKLTLFLTKALEPFNISIWEFSKMSKIPFYRLNAENILQYLYDNGFIQQTFDSILGGLTDLLFALIFWFFMIIGKDRFEERLKVAYFSKKEKVQSNLDSINSQLQSYLLIKTVVSLLVGFLVTLICLAYNIDFPIVWGLITFILNYIPNIGSLLASLAPIFISLIEYGFGYTSMSFAVLLLIVHNLTGNILEPHLMGRQMDLSPVFVLFSLIFWGYVWGIVGMFLAVPIAATMKILFSNIDPLKPLAIIIGSKGSLLVLPDQEPEIPQSKIITKE